MAPQTPIVDLGKLADPEHHQAEVEKAQKGFLEWGFVEFVNHGIPDEVFDTAFTLDQQFFSLPAEEKAKSNVDIPNRLPLYQPGYKGDRDVRTVGGIKREKEHFLFIHARKAGVTIKPTPNAPLQNVWPEKPENYREALEELHESISCVVDQLYGVFSEALGLPPTYISDNFFGENTISRRPAFMHHYFQFENPENDAVPPHEDASVFTVVVQANLGVDGLQVLKDGEWVTISPSKYGLLVNSGDVMKVWSNGDFKSMTHRVKNNKAGSRYTMAYFVVPPQDLIVQPIMERQAAGVEPKYQAFKFSDLAAIKNTMPDAKHVENYQSVQ